MSYTGKVQNGVVVLPPEAQLPEGTEVEVIPRTAPQATEQMLRSQSSPPPTPNGDWRFPEGRHLGPFRAPVEDWRLLANEAAAD